MTTTAQTYTIEWTDADPDWRDALSLPREGALAPIVAEARAIAPAEGRQRAVVKDPAGALVFDTGAKQLSRSTPSS